MSRIVREPGGFYYAVDDYGHREPVNMSTGVEAADALIYGAPIALKIVMYLTRMVYAMTVGIRNRVMVEEDVEKFAKLDAKMKMDFGGGIVGDFLYLCVIGLYWDIIVLEIIFSLGRRVVKLFTKGRTDNL